MKWLSTNCQLCPQLIKHWYVNIKLLNLFRYWSVSQQCSAQHKSWAIQLDYIIIAKTTSNVPVFIKVRWINDVQFKSGLENQYYWMCCTRMSLSSETVCPRHTAIDIATSITYCKTKHFWNHTWTEMWTKNSTVKQRLVLMPQNIDFLHQQFEEEQKQHLNQTSVIHVAIADADAAAGQRTRRVQTRNPSNCNLSEFEKIIRLLTGNIKPIISAVQIQHLDQKVELQCKCWNAIQLLEMET